jgi:hypothetical protein
MNGSGMNGSDMNEEQNTARRDNPIWETIVMVLSFGLLWAWFWVRQNVMRTPGAEMPAWWQPLLGLALLALIIITVRRVLRVKRAFEEQELLNKSARPGMPFPYGMPDPRGDDARKTRK